MVLGGPVGSLILPTIHGWVGLTPNWLCITFWLITSCNPKIPIFLMNGANDIVKYPHYPWLDLPSLGFSRSRDLRDPGPRCTRCTGRAALFLELHGAGEGVVLRKLANFGWEICCILKINRAQRLNPRFFWPRYKTLKCLFLIVRAILIEEYMSHPTVRWSRQDNQYQNQYPTRMA